MDPLVFGRELKLGVLVHIKPGELARGALVISDEAGRKCKTSFGIGTIGPRAGPGGDAGELLQPEIHSA